MACHAVSKDGKTLVAVAGDDTAPSPAFPGENVTATPGICATPNVCQETFSTDYRSWVSFPLPGMPPPTGNVDLTPTKLANLFGGNVAVNPDGKYTVFGDVQLYVADTASGMFFTNTGLDNIALDPGNVGLMMPAFSPDGNHLIAVEGTADPGAQGQPSYIVLANNPTVVPPATVPGTNAELVQLDFDEATHTFSNPKRVVLESALPGGQSAIAYPTYSPDSNFVAFHAGDKPTACENQCDQTETSAGALYLQSTNGGAPVRLAAVTDTPTVAAAQQNHTFEPTFNPVERGGYFWVVVSNERDWGNKISAGNAPANVNKRLWVAAIDKTTGAADPSHPPFFVEGQDENRLNMRGFWALAECIPTGSGQCSAGFQCCSGFCGPNGICVDIGNTVPTCTVLGGMCPMDGPDGGAPLPCCGAPTVQCISGTCQIPISR
jgi:hypothetical protein